MIHPTAIIHKSAVLGTNVKVGPYSVIENDVTIGDDCKIGNFVTICSDTSIAEGCHILHCSSIGEIPQDLKFDGEKTDLIIGDNTTIREFCTLNRGTLESNKTQIGSNVLLMAYVHIGHDCCIKNDVILANGVQLGGHVIIDDYAIVGGLTPVHQFCRIGKHSLVGGGLRVVQDIPPYIIANGQPLRFSGINIIGLRRKKFTSNQRTNIKRAYKLLYNSNYNISQATEKIENTLNKSTEISIILNFIESSKRGLI